MKAGANCLAFGAGVGGFLAGYYVRECADRVRQGRSPIRGLMRQSPYHRLFNFIKSSLERGRPDRSALAERLGAATGLDLDRIAGPLIAQWVQAGLLNVEGRWLDLTLAGRFWQVTLTQNLLDWLEQSLRECHARQTDPPHMSED
ncbi:hypothetical protein [Thiocystis violascens]|uniref:hypothetical protein n=1 Tax=Thiocystis violascens TaxID=73141 RepID=UPI00022C27B1|nr:hypothetical protein [Thiocystis violascens]